MPMTSFSTLLVMPPELLHKLLGRLVATAIIATEEEEGKEEGSGSPFQLLLLCPPKG